MTGMQRVVEKMEVPGQRKDLRPEKLRRTSVTQHGEQITTDQSGWKRSIPFLINKENME